ncbi:MAG TPA: universal stress protein [Solirubrobacterales bacterium]
MARKLVVGYDGSDRGGEALVLGEAFAQALGLELLVVTAVSAASYMFTEEEFERALEAQREALARSAGEHLAGEGAEFAVIAGSSPAAALHDYAEEVEPAGIVIGSAHHGALGRILLGSVGSALLTGAPCPILVAPHGYSSSEPAQFRRLGVGVDGSEESDAAMAVAGALAKRLDAELLAVAVVEPPDFGHMTPPALYESATYQEAVADAMQKVLDRYLAEVPEGVRASSRLAHGDAGLALAEAAAELDLMIVGSRRHGPLRRALLGGVTHRLMHHCPSPLLVLPRDASPATFGL